MSEELDPNYAWASVEIDETLVGRRAGGSASEKARELRRAAPIATAIARLTGQHSDERAWRRGASGERLTAWWLGRLPEGWFVFNDIPVGDRGANIDHLVLGPGGGFTINAKNLTGRVWVGPSGVYQNGYRTHFVRNSRHEAERASRLLTASVGRPVEVQAVLAIIADEWVNTGTPKGVFVGSPRGVKRWLAQRPPELTSTEVTAIAAAAAKPTTWQPKRTMDEVCPCGGKRVRRERRSDGEAFIGCSRFPSCRRTWPLIVDQR